MRFSTAAVFLSAVLIVCSSQQPDAGSAQGTAADQQDTAIPASAATAQERLAASPRHGEWVMVKTGANDSVRAWIVYPERSTPAPVVVVIHEIFGVSNWMRAVTDQLAADGFIAIAPDLLTRFNIPNTAAGEPNGDSARVRIREIQPAEYQPQIRAVAEYAMNLPAAAKKYGVVGFCWGGVAVFAHAVFYPDVNAVASYYGGTPEAEDYAQVKAPVLGLYGENDERVNSTIARAEAAAKANGFTYEPHKFTGAGHGFLRTQNDANGQASKDAWPLTVSWFRKYLGS